jgi:Uma2 family endonuclease
MNSILLQELTEIQLTSDDPEERFITSGITWEQYEHLLSIFDNNSSYRISYLDETLQIMSPSRLHEINKKNISRLLEVYFTEKRIPFWGLGSTTFRKKGEKVGKEPDECYCIGEDKEFPDLAIEIILTSGGIDDLKVYQKLEIKEVWFWQDHQFSIYSLQKNNYQKVTKSQLLPDLDLSLLANYVNYPNPLDAILEFREIIRNLGQ